MRACQDISLFSWNSNQSESSITTSWPIRVFYYQFHQIYVFNAYSHQTFDPTIKMTYHKFDTEYNISDRKFTIWDIYINKMHPLISNFQTLFNSQKLREIIYFKNQVSLSPANMPTLQYFAVYCNNRIIILVSYNDENIPDLSRV